MLVRESIQDLFKGPSDPKIIKQYEDEKEEAEGFLEFIRDELNMINGGHIDDNERQDMRSGLYHKMDEFWYTKMSEILQDEYEEQWSKLQDSL